MERFNLNKKHHSGFSIASSVLSGVSILLIIVAVVITFNKGNNILIGYMGIFSFIASFLGLIFGILGLYEEEKEKLYSYIGIPLNSLCFLLLLYLNITT